jgi:flagellar biosynthesis protein FlhF
MVIKRYIVNNMNEAMTRIRYELGKDAVIISQRKIRKPGVKGFFSKKVIEVTAAVENKSKKKKYLNNEEYNNGLDMYNLSNKEENLYGNSADMKNSIEALKRAFQEKLPDNEEELNASTNKKYNSNEIYSNLVKKNKIDKNIQKNEEKIDSNQEILSQMQEMKNILTNIADGKTEQEQSSNEIELLLKENDVNEKVIEKIFKSVDENKDDISEFEKVKIAIKECINILETNLEGTVVLVGPTGVGKTTTIAKLAGRLALIENKKVGLITVDTYRIGAVDQLKTYADIMNIPFKIVFSIKEMEAAVKDMSDCDVVLIDTTGRSSKNTMQLSELRAFVKKANTDNIHLVISCTTKTKDIDSIIEGYNIFNYNNVIITKLDETCTYGSILNILEMSNKHLSYVTIGQNVPDDIKKLTSEEISKLVLGEDKIC